MRGPPHRMPHQPRALIGLVLTSIVLLVAGCASSGGAAKSSSSSSPASASASAVATVSPQLRALLPAEIQSSNVIVNKAPEMNPPILFLDTSGKPTGATYDILVAMGKELGVTFEFQQLAFPGLIPGLQAQNFDISVGSLGDTKARQSILDFVDVLSSDTVIMVRAADVSKYNGYDTFCGKTLGTLSGAFEIQAVQSASAACVASGKSAITVDQYPTSADGFAQLLAGRNDGEVGPGISLKTTAKTAGGGTQFAVTKASYPSSPWAIGITKNRGTLAQAIQGALLALVKDGQYAAILKTYGLVDYALTPAQVLINGAGAPGSGLPAGG